MPRLAAPPAYYLLILTAVMSAFLFVMMALDKRKARRGAWRISEKTLFVFALLGGALGGTAGMFLFHHKTKHGIFRIGFPLLAAAQLALIAYLLLRA